MQYSYCTRHLQQKNEDMEMISFITLARGEAATGVAREKEENTESTLALQQLPGEFEGRVRMSLQTQLPPI